MEVSAFSHSASVRGTGNTGSGAGSEPDCGDRGVPLALYSIGSRAPRFGSNPLGQGNAFTDSLTCD